MYAALSEREWNCSGQKRMLPHIHSVLTIEGEGYRQQNELEADIKESTDSAGCLNYVETGGWSNIAFTSV